MRVSSTAYTTELNIRNLQARRDALEQTQAQVSTGRRLVTPSDDPVAIAGSERARSELARIEIERRAMAFASNALGQADGALSDATELLQNARETIVAAGNGAYGPTERTMLAEQLRQVRDQLLVVANRGDGAGGFVFGGNGTRTAPFAEGAAPISPVAYQPAAAEQQVGPEQPFTTLLDGESAFTSQLARSGGSQNIFSVLDSAVAVLRDPASTPTMVSAQVVTALNGLDSGIDAMQLKRTHVGEQLRAIEARELSLADGEVHLRGHLAELVDVDLVEALSNVSAQQSALDAAMKTYSQISKMSLFQYL